MKSEIAQLVAEVSAVTGAPPPAVMSGDAPTLADDAAGDGELYYVGLIGGKDVGKTSLVNAIAGRTLADPTGHGEGTRTAIAYCHRDAADRVRRDLADAAGEGKLEVQPHDADDLRRQVLLDLPDVDSRYEDHIRLTRAMLRHMLYPVWVQSVEKYADRRPRELLEQVAAGNDPANFVFVLSKVDQLIDREGLQAAGELAVDFGERLQKALELEKVPEVLLCSAKRPDDYDLPRLRKMLGVERSAERVATDRERAGRRQTLSVARWMADRDLDARAAAAGRLLDEAAESLAERVAAPILEEALPRLDEDAGHRMALAEPAARARCAAWPIVGWIDAAAAPLIGLVRRNLSSGDDGVGGAGGAPERRRPIDGEERQVSFRTAPRQRFGRRRGVRPAPPVGDARGRAGGGPTAAAARRGAGAAAGGRRRLAAAVAAAGPGAVAVDGRRGRMVRARPAAAGGDFARGGAELDAVRAGAGGGRAAERAGAAWRAWASSWRTSWCCGRPCGCGRTGGWRRGVGGCRSRTRRTPSRRRRRRRCCGCETCSPRSKGDATASPTSPRRRMRCGKRHNLVAPQLPSCYLGPMLTLLVALALSLQPATQPTTRSATQPAEWKQRVMQRAGIDVWPEVNRIAFTFKAELPDGRVIKRRHDYDRRTGVNAVTVDGETNRVNVGNFRPAAATVEDQALYRAWINDSYWLLMPLKLDDGGVSFGRPQMAQDGLIVTMSFDGVGLTPGDEYDLRVDLGRDVIDQWTYRPNAETTLTFTWEGYEEFGGLYLSTVHEPLDGGPRITFEDVEVER